MKLIRHDSIFVIVCLICISLFTGCATYAKSPQNEAKFISSCITTCSINASTKLCVAVCNCQWEKHFSIGVIAAANICAEQVINR